MYSNSPFDALPFCDYSVQNFLHASVKKSLIAIPNPLTRYHHLGCATLKFGCDYARVSQQVKKRKAFNLGERVQGEQNLFLHHEHSTQKILWKKKKLLSKLFYHSSTKNKVWTKFSCLFFSLNLKKNENLHWTPIWNNKLKSIF